MGKEGNIHVYSHLSGLQRFRYFVVKFVTFEFAKHMLSSLPQLTDEPRMKNESRNNL